MNAVIHWLMVFATLIILPPAVVGVIRKTKARLQNRVGAPIWQPYLNLIKLLAKGETVSSTASWVFRAVSAANLSIVFLVAILTPWLSFKPNVDGDDLFLIVYLFALMRFLMILSALDAASPFGGFAASREATLSLLVEPAVVLSLAALALPQHTSSLTEVFTTWSPDSLEFPLWLLSGTGLFLSSLAELSRMPVDDPTTHLELTMVHEAMIIENSGKNLALVDFTYAVRLTVLFGLSAQCFLHAVVMAWPMAGAWRAVWSIGGILILALTTAVIEGTAVKLAWRKVPEFIAYGLTMSLLAAMVAVARGLPP